MCKLGKFGYNFKENVRQINFATILLGQQLYIAILILNHIIYKILIQFIQIFLTITIPRNTMPQNALSS